MDFAAQLRLLQATQGDPARLALAMIDLKYPDLPEGERALLKDSLEAAAIAHWIDETILAAILEISVEESTRRLAALRRLTVVEPFPARGTTACNVHEATRLALRRSLFANQPERFRTLSSRVEMHFAMDPTPSGRIERTFHRLWLDPAQAGPEIRQMEYDCSHKLEDAQALAGALQECVADTDAPPLVRCWACWCVGTIRTPYLRIAERCRLAQEALQLAESVDSDYAIAASAVLLGIVLAERGNPGDNSKALGLFQRSLDIRERLLADNPKSAQAARDVCVSLDRVGDSLANRRLPGDSDKALDLFRRSLEISERLLSENPKSARAARDVSISLDCVGDFLASRGMPDDSETALDLFRRSLEISERLLSENPKSAQAARDVSIGLSQLGRFLASRGLPGDSDRALVLFQRDLELSERLLADNPESGQADRDVYVSLIQLSDFLAKRGLPDDSAQALGYYQRSLEVSERLLANNPESAQAVRDVLVSLERMADTATNPAVALRHQERSLELARQLWERTGSWEMGRTLVVSLLHTSEFHAQAGQIDDEAKYLIEAFTLLDSFAREDRPLDAQMRSHYEKLKQRFTGEPRTPEAGARP